MDATTRIKNLSIALEALSRLHHDNLGDSVYALLREEVNKLKEKKGLNLTARPAEPPPFSSILDTFHD